MYISTMKSLVAVLMASFLFLASLLPMSATGEFSKIPAFIDHYNYHKAQASGDFDMIDFIVMHYSIGSQHEEPVHETALPLFGSQVSGLQLFMPNLFSFDFTDIPQGVSYTSFYANFYDSLDLGLLIQPPRI